MSYCGDKRPWISPFHYKKLYDTNLRPQAAFVTDRGHVLWVRGWATLKGDAAQIEVIRPPDASGIGAPVQPLLTFNRYSASLADHLASPLLGHSNAVLHEGTGDHCLRFLDTGGTALYERCFDLQFRSEETLKPTEKAGFVLDVPDPGNVADIVLLRNESGQERELTSLKVSSHAPTLTITSPSAGDKWAGEYTITWSGSDLDNDALRYDIRYSADGKKTWFPLEVGSHDTQYTFDTSEILPGNQTYIQILASDGFNTTHTEVGPLVVVKQENSSQATPTAPGPSQIGPVTAITPVPGQLSPSGGPDAGILALIGGISLAVVVGLAVTVMILRRSRKSPIAPVGPNTAPPAWNQYQVPPHPSANQFRWAEQEYGRLRGELAAGRLHPQQYQAALAQLRVQDPQGRHWMLAPDTGQWLVYDGRGWVRADPPRQR